jgi:hypothetical protein
MFVKQRDVGLLTNYQIPKNIRRKDMYAVGHFFKDTVVSSEKDSITLGKSKITVKFRAHGVKFK